jgi:hypothetical protein
MSVARRPRRHRINGRRRAAGSGGVKAVTAASTPTNSSPSSQLISPERCPCASLNPSPPGWVEDLHPQAIGHARHTAKSSRDMPGSIRPLRRDGLRGATRLDHCLGSASAAQLAPLLRQFGFGLRRVEMQPRPIPQIRIGQFKGKQNVLHSCVRHGLNLLSNHSRIVPSILLPLPHLWPGYMVWVNTLARFVPSHAYDLLSVGRFHGTEFLRACGGTELSRGRWI